MPAAVKNQAVELESLLDHSGDFYEYDGDLESCSSPGAGLFFQRPRPPTALQTAFALVAVRTIRSAARWTAYCACCRVSWRILYLISQLSLVAFTVLVVVVATFFPSYTHPPAHYTELRKRTLESSNLGRANINNQQVYIAASIYDAAGELAGGAWGQRLIELIDILGPQNVFLSIYEDNPTPAAKSALADLTLHLSCNKSVVAESFDLETLPKITLPDGIARTRRVTFLAEVRNRAMRPLQDLKSAASRTTFDKVLYLNDVIFDPVDAANLLFSTNIDKNGQTQYRAACAVDFDNPFKFYDTYATRDLEGYESGVIVYPFFTNAGLSESRNDVLAQKDAVRVQSCWGGMIAFEAKWWQPGGASAYANNTTSKGLRFRSETELYWDSSECCLINADLQAMKPRLDANSTDIYMNPYIRVAYTETVHQWLAFARRFERILEPVQKQLNYLSHRPGYNPRRLHQPGQTVTDRIWTPDDGQDNQSLRSVGHYRDVERSAPPGGLCGGRKLSILSNAADLEDGYPRWRGEPIPFDPAVDQL